MALALATLAAAAYLNVAHATSPGENGVIVFESPDASGASVIKRVSPGYSAISNLAKGNSPSVSPNGKKVAFVNNRNLYVMNIDGSNIVTLDDNENSFSPAWRPDGSQVVYAIVDGTKWGALWTINPDGTGKTFMRYLVSKDTVLKGLDLAWSPSISVYTFNDDAGGLSTADTINPGPPPTLATGGHGSSWAPDGASILFNDTSGNQFEINPDGSNRRSVPPAGATSGSSAISPDGAFIAGGVYTGNVPLLTTRARAGAPTTFAWTTETGKTSWSRTPKNCYETTPQGGGGVLAGDVDFYAEQRAIAVMPDNGAHGVLQHAIAVGPDQRLYYRLLQSNPFGGAPTWTGFARVPGVAGNPNGVNAKKIAIAGAKDGSSQVVIINANDNVVYHALRYANGSWSGFSALDGDPVTGGAFQAKDVAITINASAATSPGNAQVIANNLNGLPNGWPNGVVFHRVRWAAGNWTPFIEVPHTNALTHELAIAADENGNTDVLATAYDGTILHVLRTGSSWGNWVDVGTPAGTTLSASTDIAVTRALNGTAQLIFTDSAGNVKLQERATPNVNSTWQSPVATTSIASTVGRAVSISAGATAGSSSQLLLTRTFPQ